MSPAGRAEKWKIRAALLFVVLFAGCMESGGSSSAGEVIQEGGPSPVHGNASGVVIEASTDRLFPGESVEFRVRVQNLGNGDAEVRAAWGNITTEDALPNAMLAATTVASAGEPLEAADGFTNSEVSPTPEQELRLYRVAVTIIYADGTASVWQRDFGISVLPALLPDASG